MGPSNTRNWARGAFFAFGIALAFPPAPAAAGVCQYQNLMPEFFAFEAATKNLAPDIRAERFAKEFVARHPGFYGDTDLDWPARVQKDSLRLLDPSQPESFPGFPPLTEARLHAVAATVTNGFAAAQDKFLKSFPDFRCQDSVEFGPSFRRFDGIEYKDAAGLGHIPFPPGNIKAAFEQVREVLEREKVIDPLPKPAGDPPPGGKPSERRSRLQYTHPRALKE